MSASLQFHHHQEFRLAENADSEGCCCFWRSRAKPKEYIINERGELVPVRKASKKQRTLANERLCDLLKKKFDDVDVDNERAFELLKARINDPMNNGHAIDDSKLRKLVNEIYILKNELASSKL